jgi:hypothetical protein
MHDTLVAIYFHSDMIFKMHCSQGKMVTLTAHTESQITDCETTNFNGTPRTKLFFNFKSYRPVEAFAF